jgi:hypothetical protein
VAGGRQTAAAGPADHFVVADQPGTQLYARLRSGADEARRAADAAAATAAAARSRLDAIAAERLQAVHALARLQLPELSDAAAEAAWPEAVPELRRLEQERDARVAELQRELADADTARRRADERLRDVTTELDAIVARREAIGAEVAAALAADPAYAEARLQVTQAEVGLARDLERSEELQTEAKELLPAYRDSRLFQYLLRRGFGTAEYRGRGFAARMDRRLADFIGWPRAIAGYRFLTTTPEVVRLEVERRTALVQERVAALTAREDELEAQRGLPAVVAEGELVGRRREAALREVELVQQRTGAAHTALRDEGGGRGRFHGIALQRLAEWLGRAEVAALERRARATPDPQDDALVAQLRATSEELQQAAAAVPALEAEARRLDSVADGLDAVLVRFRRAEFDAGRSWFTPIDAGQLVHEVRNGRLHWEDLWSRLQAEHRFRAPPMPRASGDAASVLQGVGFALRIAGAVAEIALRSSGRGHGVGSGGGFGSGRGLGGGGFSSGRGIGGGGFTSGKGF